MRSMPMEDWVGRWDVAGRLRAVGCVSVKVLKAARMSCLAAEFELMKDDNAGPRTEETLDCIGASNVPLFVL